MYVAACKTTCVFVCTFVLMYKYNGNTEIRSSVCVCVCEWVSVFCFCADIVRRIVFGTRCVSVCVCVVVFIYKYKSKFESEFC